MSELPVAIESNIPFLLLLGIAVLSLAFAYWHYRFVIPRISEAKRRLLMTLRFITFLSLLLLFIQPKLMLLFQREIKPRVSVYVDNSLSMSIKDGKKKRWEENRAVLHKLDRLHPESRWLFNRRVVPLNDSSFFITKEATDFEALFKHIDENSAENIVLISDGNVTEGSYPLRLKRHPGKKIFTIGVGHIEKSADFFIDNVLFKPVVYRGEAQTIRVIIGAKHTKKAVNTTVRLLRNGRVLALKSIFIDTLNALKAVDFINTPTAVGRNKFKVVLEAAKADANPRNNTFHFLQHVLKKKLQIAIFSGFPGYEGKFLNQLLREEPDFDCHFFVESRQNSMSREKDKFLEQPSDVLVLQNFPGPFTTAKTLSVVAEWLKKGKSSLFLFLGEKTNLSKLRKLLKYTPFTQLPKKTRPETSLNLIAKESSIFDLFEDPSANTQFWQQVPPLTLLYTSGKLKNGAQIILNSNQRPVAISWSKPGIRALTFEGDGFWRWHFLMQNSGALRTGYAKLLEHSVRWLAEKKELQPVMLQSDVTKTTPGSALHLSGYIYDATFLPVRDGALQLQVKQGKEMLDIPTVMDSSGRYSAEFVPVTEGTLLFMAKGFRFDRFYGQAPLEIEVAAAEKEFIQSDLNRRYLQQIAQKNFGKYAATAAVDSLLKQIPQEISIQKEKIGIELWHNPYFLALILLSIFLEWILRRRFGLV